MRSLRTQRGPLGALSTQKTTKASLKSSYIAVRLKPQAWLAQPQACLAGSQDWLARPQAWLAGPLAWLAGPKAWLVGPEGGRTNKWTNKQTENLPILQDYGPFWGHQGLFWAAVEWGDFPSIRTFVHPSVPPSGPSSQA